MASVHLELKIGNCLIQESMYLGFNGFVRLFRLKFAFTFMRPAPIFMQWVLGILHQRLCVLMSSKCLQQIPSGCHSSSYSFYNGLISSLKHCKVKIETYLDEKKTSPNTATPIQVLSTLRLMRLMAQRELTILRREFWKPCFLSEKRINCFPSTLRRWNLKMQQSPDILDLCLKKTWAVKSLDY